MALSQLTEYSSDEQRILLELARTSIRSVVCLEKPVIPELFDYSNRLQEKKACFVTLTANQLLRGCVGSLEQNDPLAIGVTKNAAAAAVQDPRFDPVSQEELVNLAIEISVLSEAEPLPVKSKEELFQALRPGRDGVILSEGRRRATFLPKVWEQVDAPEAFIKQLKLKAGLPADYWSDSLRIEIYQVLSINDSRE